MIGKPSNRRAWTYKPLGPVLLAFAVSFPGATVCNSQTSPGDLDFFETRIRPVLVERCYKCHSATSEKLKGGLLLDTREGMLKGGESGKPAIVPGAAEKSLVIEAIRYKNEDLQMPPKQKLSAPQIADFVSWVSSGAPDPRTNGVGIASTERTNRHWA